MSILQFYSFDLCSFRQIFYVQKQPPEVFRKKKVFLEILQNSQENTYASGLRPATSLKKSLRHRCFLANFAKFLRTSFYRTPLSDCFWMFIWSLFEGLFRFKIVECFTATTVNFINFYETCYNILFLSSVSVVSTRSLGLKSSLGKLFSVKEVVLILWLFYWYPLRKSILIWISSCWIFLVCVYCCDWVKL